MIFATLQHTSEHITNQLQQAERLALAGKWRRFLNRPVAYLQAIGFRTICYPFLRRAWPVACKLVTGDRVRVTLPAATDLFLLGCKSHPSELRLARFLLQQLRAGDVVLDVGAHIGFFSLLAAGRVGSGGRVLAIEPAPEAFTLLQYNTANYPAITCFEVLLDAQDGARSLYRFPPLYQEFNTTDPSQYAGEKWLQHNLPQSSTCTARSGDSLLQQLQLQPQLIKLDVEGHEAEVLRGLQQTLTHQSPVIVLEFAAPRTGAAQRHQLADAWLQQQGYQPHALDTAGVARPLTQPVVQYVAATGWRSDNIVYFR